MFQELPLLDRLLNKFTHVDLSDVAIVSCQHLLQSNAITFDYLFKLGLKPERIFLLGKAYSTSKDVMMYLETRGVFAHPHSTSFQSHEQWDAQFYEYVSTFIADAVTRLRQDTGVKRVIVVDDGGCVIEQMNGLSLPWDIQCIEWTSSGYRKLLDCPLQYPVLNVARSRAKLEVESPMIGEGIVQKIVEGYPQVVSSQKKALVIGAGPIGLAVQRALEAVHKAVEVIDVDTPLSEALTGDVDVIIGCTGASVLGMHDLERLSQVLLVSASSSDREFPAAGIRALFPKNEDTHRDYTHKGITLMNAGFPVTFDGGIQFIPLEKIQLTLGLIFTGVCLAASQTFEKGWNDFPADKGDDVVRDYLAFTRGDHDLSKLGVE